MFYPQQKAPKRKFSTKLFTISTACAEKICGKKEWDVIFCGDLKSLRIRRFLLCGKNTQFHKSDYGNESIKIPQIFLLVLSQKFFEKFRDIFEKKKRNLKSYGEYYYQTNKKSILTDF